MLLENVWDYFSIPNQCGRCAHQRLRYKIDKSSYPMLHTVRGSGYMLRSYGGRTRVRGLFRTTCGAADDAGTVDVSVYRALYRWHAAIFVFLNYQLRVALRSRIDKSLLDQQNLLAVQHKEAGFPAMFRAIRGELLSRCPNDRTYRVDANGASCWRRVSYNCRRLFLPGKVVMKSKLMLNVGEGGAG